MDNTNRYLLLFSYKVPLFVVETKFISPCDGCANNYLLTSLIPLLFSPFSTKLDLLYLILLLLMVTIILIEGSLAV